MFYGQNSIIQWGQNHRYPTFLAFIRAELFSQLPKGIGYISPAAADMLIQHTYQLGALNLNRLPKHFRLLRTRKNQFVLHYDKSFATDDASGFRPTINYLDETDVKIEPLITEDDLNGYIGNTNLRNVLRTPATNAFLIEHIKKEANNEMDLTKAQAHRLKEQLSSIKNKSNEAALQAFINQLSVLTEKQQQFIIHHYLIGFRDWSYFANDKFYQQLNHIKQYGSLQFQWLSYFTQHSAHVKGDLNEIITAFDKFWDVFKYYTHKHHLVCEDYSPSFTVPTSGMPQVYMERLTQIFYHTDKIDTFVEQLENLSGIDLSTYAAPYALLYEDLTCVSEEMVVHYHQIAHDNIKFNPHYQQYNTPLEKLFDPDLALNAIDDAYYYELLYAPESISKSDFFFIDKEKTLEQRIEELNKHPYRDVICNFLRIPSCYALFFRCAGSQHERVLLKTLREVINLYAKHYDIMYEEDMLYLYPDNHVEGGTVYPFETFKKLPYKQKLKLNDTEGFCKNVFLIHSFVLLFTKSEKRLLDHNNLFTQIDGFIYTQIRGLKMFYDRWDIRSLVKLLDKHHLKLNLDEGQFVITFLVSMHRTEFERSIKSGTYIDYIPITPQDAKL